jgi:hypothetical protein
MTTAAMNYTMSGEATQNLRLSHFDVRQRDFNGPYTGTVEFPLVTGLESIFADLYAQLLIGEHFHSPWCFQYSEENALSVKSINSVSLFVEQSNFIGLSVDLNAEKVAQKRRQLGFLAPARIYTWNDAIFEATNNNGLFEDGRGVRSYRVTVEKPEKEGETPKVSGSFVILGDGATLGSATNLTMGFKSRRWPFVSETRFHVKNLRIKETPVHNEGEDKLFVDLSRPTYTELLGDGQEKPGTEFEVKTPSIASALFTSKYDWVGEL